MSITKAVCSPLVFKLSCKQCPTSERDIKDMSRVPYAFAISSLMYVMVCTRWTSPHVVGVVSRYLSNLGKEQSEVVK